MEPRHFARRLQLVVGTALVCLLASAAQADSVDDQPPLVLLAPADSQLDFAVLLIAIAAQLSDFEVEPRIAETEPLPESLDAQAELARSVAADQGALAVVWLELDAVEVCLFVDDGEDGLVQQRQLPEGEDDWEELSDAIASMLRSMLVPWLEEIAPGGEPPGGEEGEERAAEEVAETAEPGAESPPPRPSEMLVLLGARVGYEPVVMSQEDRYLNGAYVGLGLCLGRYLGFDAGLAVFQIARVRIDGQDLRLTRWPVRLAASGRLPIRRAVVGLRLAFVINPTRIDGVPSGETVDDAELDYLGLGPSIFVGFGATEWLELSIDGGVDFYFDSNDYIYRDQVMFTFGPVQPRFFAGATFYFFSG